LLRRAGFFFFFFFFFFFWSKTLQTLIHVLWTFLDTVCFPPYTYSISTVYYTMATNHGEHCPFFFS
jgi:hypothetical protein